MAANGMRDDVPPWSFFLPVTVAVVVGILIADGVRYAVRQVFADPAPATEAPPRTSAVEAPPAPDAPAADADAAPAAAAAAAATQAPAAPAAGPPSATSAETAEATAGPALPALPGPVSAKRDGSERACINGTVARRSGNGWEQVTENDAPLRCSADSP